MKQVTIKVNGKEIEAIKVFENNDKTFVIQSKQQDILFYVENENIVSTQTPLKDLVDCMLNHDGGTYLPADFDITENEAQVILDWFNN